VVSWLIGYSSEEILAYEEFFGGATLVLTVSDVTFNTRERKIIHNVSLNIDHGECVSIVGINGAGKTTLLKIICGILKPSRGTIRISGWDIESQEMRAKRNLGYVPDTSQLPEFLTGGEFLLLVGRIYGIDLHAYKQALFREACSIGLGDGLRKLIKTYSLGERRKLSILSAILHRPSLLVMDEPTNGLDNSSLTVFFDLLANLKGEGVSILVATHSVEFTRTISDRTLVMVNGEISASNLYGYEGAEFV